MRKHILIVLVLAVFANVNLFAQTTELVYSLGKASSTMHIASVVTDASENIFVCGSYLGTNVNFNPLVPGSDSLRTSANTSFSDGFIAKYNPSGQLQKVIAFGGTNADVATKIFADGSGNIYMGASINGSNVKFDNPTTGFGGVTAGSGSMVLVKYNNNLVLQANMLLKASSPVAGDIINDIKVFGTDIYITGSLFNPLVNFNPGGDAANLSPAGSTDIFIARYNASLLNIWAYVLGGADGDAGNSIDLDGSGNVYLTGIFRGQNINLNPTGSTTVSETGGGSVTNGDAFVAKYTNTTSLSCQWAFHIGAASIDQGKSILVEKTATPNIYVGGVVGTDVLNVYFDPASTTSASYLGKGANDLFVASYTAAGAYRWHVATGSTNNEDLPSMAFDGSGNVVLTGFAGGNVDFGNSKTIAGIGGKDAYFAVLAKATGLATAAYNVGGSGDEQGNGVTVSATGKILVAGDLLASGDYDPSTGVKTITPLGSQDGFIARYLLCTPPSITAQPVDVTKCAGAAAPFSVTANDATSYQWKNGTSVISGATTASYNIAAVAAGDAGNYTVDVTNACQTVTSTIAKLTVNPKPSITSAATGTVCSGVALGYTIASDVASGYSWSRAAVTGITNAAVTAQTTSSITETLVNSTASAVNVIYTITPTSTVGSCAGAAFTYTVTVNPTPAITSSATGNICSGFAQNYTIISNVASAYNWSRAAVSGIINAAATNQTTSPITETLVNNSTSAVNVVYTITPTATTGSCAGTPFTYTVTVNPKPAVTSVATGTVCSGVAQNYSITSNIPSTYSWTRAAVAGVANATGSGSTSSLTEALTLSAGTTTSVNVTYIIAPTSTTGSCAGTPFNYVVTVNPSPSITSAASGAFCSGFAQSYSITSNVASTFNWSRAAVAGITNAAVTNQASNPITESLTNSSGTAQTVTYIITPTSTTGSCAGAPFNYSVTVNPNLAPTVAVSGATAICSGGSITLTATASSAGTTPGYQWKKGATVLTGETNAAYTNNTPANGDSYTVTVTSSAACASPVTVTSTASVVSVTGTLTPTVSVSVNPGSTICAGTSITFTATASSAGSTPAYQWKKGATVLTGETNATYTTTTAASGDSYSVVVTSSSSCSSAPTVTSTPITMTVNPVVTPTLGITSTGPTTICAGANITFNSSQTGGGTPTYKWKLGSSYISGATNASYTATSASNNNSYSLEMTSTALCATPAIVTSTPIIVTVNPVVAPTISITSSLTTICAGTSITFNSSQTGGGSPTYKWKLGSGYIAGATNSSYTAISPSNNDMYSLEMTSTTLCATPAAVTSSGITVTVIPVVAPSVSITADNSTICAGTNITFTASPANGGTPTYQWYKNSSLISNATNATFATTTAANNDSYSVAMVSNALCASTAPVNSNAVVITITASPTPAVSITAVPGNVICAGASVTFTAAPSNGGGSPAYKWKSGSSYISGATNATYTTTGASNSDSYSVEMTSSLSCVSTATVLSNSIVMTVNALQTPTVSVVTNTATTICAGTSVTFTATAATAGSAPTYQWKKGSTILTGETNTTYTTTTAANGDSYSVVVTSSAICTTAPTVTSTPITITVNPVLIPSVSVSTPTNTICAGASIKFTATTVNGGGNPTFQWKNGTNDISGATNSTYTTTTASNGDSYSVVLVSNAVCASPSTLTSNSIVTIVNAIQTPTVTVVPSTTTICAGNDIKFTATPNNAGSTPLYQWQKGSTPISGATTSSYNTTTASNGDTYSIIVTSTVACPSTPTVTSTPISVTVNAVTTPTVTITANTTTICAGASIVFTASATNTGTINLYQWYKGSSSIGGETNSTYTTTTAVDADTYSVVASSNANCSSAASATSNTIAITVNPILTPTVSISANNSTICPGTSITFTASPLNGGNAPTYKWKLDSSYITSATAATYTTTTAANGDSYSVEMTGNAACASSNAAVISNAVVITTTVSVAPTVSVTTNPGTTICHGTNITFTAVVGNGGNGPTYQWNKNSTAISGATNVTYSTSSLVDGDKISVDIVSNSSCASTPNASSTQTTITVNPLLTPFVTFISSASSICAGGTITFTATPVNGGTVPKYKWMNNASVISGATDAVYTTTSLAAGNSISVELTSNETCVTSTTGVSTGTSITVNPIIVPTVSIAVNNSTICAGGTVSFTASTTGGTATYKWKNGSSYITSATNATYSTSTANDGDVYSLEITNNGTCVSPTSVTSNQVTISVNKTTVITSQPTDQTVCALGNAANYAVAATGSNLVYQWKKGTTVLANSSTFAGVDTDALTISNISSNELASYTVVVTGSCGTVTSLPAALSLSSSPITIIAQPTSQTGQQGDVISLSVVASGPSLVYQWKRNGANITDDSKISGSATTVLQISNAQMTDNFSDYICVISSACAVTVSSNAVTVTISGMPTAIKSTQAQGFVVSPNPSAGQFVLSNTSAPFNVEEIEIVSMNGVVVATKFIAGTSYINETIYAQELPSGMYLVIIKGEGQQALLKVAIDK